MYVSSVIFREESFTILQTIDKPIFPVWGCMKGPQPLHIQSAAAACTPRGAAQVAASSIIFRPSPKVTGK